MPGFLTHLRVLIETAEWLKELAEGLEKKSARSPFEKKIHRLSREALKYLYPTDAPKLIVPAGDNGKGKDISKFAFMGALGPDIPGASGILAINHDWVFHVLHDGDFQKELVNAGTTKFVLQYLDITTPDEHKAKHMAYVLGHLSHIATHVLFQPFARHFDLEDIISIEKVYAMLDTQLAGYFGKSSIHSGDSWTRYMPSTNGDLEDVKRILERIYQNYFLVYPSAGPISDLEKYRLFKNETFKDDLLDGYKNVVNVALDVGYDQNQEVQLLWGLLIGEVVGFINFFLFALFTFLLDGPDKENWKAKGFWSERSIYNALSNASLAGFLLGTSISIFGLIIPFRRGLEEEKYKFFFPTKRFYKGELGLIIKVLIGIGMIVAISLVDNGEDPGPDSGLSKGLRWGFFSVVFLLAFFSFLSDSLADPKEKQVDYFSLHNARFSLVTLVVGMLQALIIWGIKDRQKENGQKEETLVGRDWALGLILPLVFFFWLWPVLYVVLGLKETRLRWPGEITVDAAINLRKPVRLFHKLAVNGTEFPRKEKPEEDKAVKKASSKNNFVPYALDDLFERAKYLSGIMAMAAVNYHNPAPGAKKENATAIFKDWNLDYRTEQEWKHLMQEKTETPIGVLEAVKIWWDDLTSTPAKVSDAVIIERLEETLFDAPAQQGAYPGTPEYDKLCGSKFAGVFFGDFTRTGQVGGLRSSRDGRVVRPGAIVLANLDMDDPQPAPSGAPPDLSGKLDAVKDAKINKGNDSAELTLLRVRKPDKCDTAAEKVSLKVADEDAKRIRLFEVGKDAPDTWPKRLGKDVGSTFAAEFDLAGNTKPWAFDFRVEALTLPGDPDFPPPTNACPTAPAPDPPGSLTAGSPICPSRAPAEIWFELIHKDNAGNVVPGLRDVAVLTIAPFIMLSSLYPVERVYVVYVPDRTHPTHGFFPGSYTMVADLIEGLKKALGSARVTYETKSAAGGAREFVPHKPVPPDDPKAAKGLYIIDGGRYRDQWVQDEFEIGYCWAPHDWMHVVLHCPRRDNTRDLGQFVVSEMPGPRLGLFNRFSTTTGDSINYGGNLEVTPPVTGPTGALPDGDAGLAVPAHPAAPLGKIILGEGLLFFFTIESRFETELDAGGALSTDLEFEFEFELASKLGVSTLQVNLPSTTTITVEEAGSRWLITIPGFSLFSTLQVRKEGADVKVYIQRFADPKFKAFLEAQKVQPLMTVDTSWLAVAHLDEIYTFVPANSGKKFKLLMADTKLASVLFKKAWDLHQTDTSAHPLTELFRGKKWIEETASGVSRPDAKIKVDRLLSRGQTYNQQIQNRKLTPIMKRLRSALNLDTDDTLKIPLYYKKLSSIPILSPLNLASAHTPNMVNMLVVGTHVFVAKPYGPRMKAADVETILKDKAVGLSGVTPAPLAKLKGHWHWARRGDKLSDLATLFSVAASSIETHTNNKDKFDASKNVKEQWDRIWIPEDNVDLLEAYVTIALKNIGLTVHFVDDWDEYHRKEGEVHCGTNVIRRPPEAAPGYQGKYWWDHYNP